MQRKFRQFVLLSILALGAWGAGQTAEVWISVEPPAPAPGAPVAVQLMQGSPFHGSTLAYEAGSDTRFQRLWKNGRRNLAGGDGVVRFDTDAAGVELLALTTGRTAGAEGPVTHFAKTFVIVGDSSAEGTLRYSELGQRLEMVPQTDPVRLARSGGGLEVQLLHEREPLAGVAVYAVPQASPDDRRRAVTDEIGLARFRLDRPGPWMLTVTHRTACDDCKTSETETLRSTLVLAVGG